MVSPSYKFRWRIIIAIDQSLDKRIRHGHSECLVCFKGYPDSHAQWEPLTASNRSSWESDWSLLFQYDPSVGPFRPVLASHPRRSKRLAPIRLFPAYARIYHYFIWGVLGDYVIPPCPPY